MVDYSCALVCCTYTKTQKDTHHRRYGRTRQKSSLLFDVQHDAKTLAKDEVHVQSYHHTYNKPHCRDTVLFTSLPYDVRIALANYERRVTWQRNDALMGRRVLTYP
uniref:Outer membrane usher protein mrkC n=1 Tax=Lygus hesperus TaxID=30085 RepID=A0A0A9ZHT9_LYGHE